jgi:prophage regulatory protein
MSQLIKLPDVIKLTGLSSSSVYRLASNGEFPKPIKLTAGGRSSAWIAEEVNQWVEERIQASRTKEVA